MSATASGDARPSAVILSTAHRLGDQRIARWVAGLTERGYSVRVVAIDDTNTRDPEHLWGDGTIEVVALTPRGRWGRLLRSVPLVVAHGGDVVVAIDPELFGVVAAAQRVRRRRSVADVHEDFPALAANDETSLRTSASDPRATRAAGVASGLTLRGRGLMAAARIVARSAAWADVTVVADDHVPPLRARNRLVGANQPLTQDDTTVAPLWRFEPDAALPVVYAGGLTAERGGLAMIEALGLSSGWRLDLFGPATDEIVIAITRAAEMHPERIRWWGPIPNRSLRHRLSHYAIGLCPLKPTPAFRRALPAKIGEYHHAGLGIVATDLPRIEEHTTAPQSAVLVDADANLAEALGSVLGRLACNTEAVQALQLAARAHRDALDETRSLSHTIGRLPL